VRSRRVGRLVGSVLAMVTIVLSSQVSSVAAGAATTVVVVQLNLCNSGMALLSCYSFGRAVDEAVEKIYLHRPDLLTVQEVCRGDLRLADGWGKLASAMARLHGSDNIVVDFVPAWNRDTDDAYRCVNGEPFGVALIHHGNGRDTHHGLYSSQDFSNEQRVWTCATVVKDQLTGCTTHLSIRPDVAMRQCRELMSVLASSWVMPKVVVAGDLNLTATPDTPTSVDKCMSAAFDRRGDGAVQHVLFTRDIRWVRGTNEAMQWTDHPLLYQRLRI
jgi:endonuclease/exonuclease/phosphatase family metal-dependent hydrolase